MFIGWNELGPPAFVGQRVVLHKPWLLVAPIRHIIVSIEQPRFKKTWRLWTFPTCLGWGQSFKTWELHRCFYSLCRKKQFSFSRKAGLTLLTGSVRQWCDCTAHSQTLFSLGHLTFSQDSTYHLGLSAQGLLLWKPFWTSLTPGSSLVFSHHFALGFVPVPACKGLVTDVFLTLRRHKADVLMTLTETHEETISIMTALCGSQLGSSLFVPHLPDLWIPYLSLQHKSTSSSLTDTIFTDFIRGSLWYEYILIYICICLRELIWFIAVLLWMPFCNKALLLPDLSDSNKYSCHTSLLWLYKACPLGCNGKVRVLVSNRINCCDLWNPWILESDRSLC